jgi:hypothetical protein
MRVTGHRGEDRDGFEPPAVERRVEILAAQIVDVARDAVAIRDLRGEFVFLEKIQRAGERHAPAERVFARAVVGFKRQLAEDSALCRWPSEPSQRKPAMPGVA